MSVAVPQSSSVIESLTAAEMAIAERAAGLSIMTLEDPQYPKVELISALGWVYAKRSEPTLTFAAYKNDRTLQQITEELDLDDAGEDAGDEGKAKPAPKRAKKSAT